ncbi:uncharacterized protein LOC142979168 [Anticarsia gemmatalis]|uniref:uncharacterized protein LOC142979168 n=1 Tax=Anticarsia gemmatalis TaxID=129554 RepID=UPI003F76FBA0
MVVCKFFQQGNCRFGQNCRFEHIYGSKYSYHASPQQQAAPAQAPSGCTDEQLVNQVQADVQSALRGGQWILSCYSPFKEKPIFPGISDLSPEEARLFIYEAKNNNNIEQAVTYMNNLFKETRQKYEQLLQPNINIIKILRSLYKGELVASPFSNAAQNTFSGASDPASSIFRSAVQNPQQNTAASIFSQGQQSIFNTQPDPAKDLFAKAASSNIFGQNQSSNAFAQNQDASAQSIFATAVQNTKQTDASSIFSSANQSIFGAQPVKDASPFSQNQNSSPFGQAPNSSPFGQAPSSSPFGPPQNSSPFGQPPSTSPFAQSQNSSPFGQANIWQKTESPASIFGQANKEIITNDPGVYSKVEELTEADMEAFKSDKFELGFVPELPPPQELCAYRGF